MQSSQSNQDSPTSVRFRSLMDLGVDAVKDGKFDEGRTYLLRAADLEPGQPLPWLWLSRTTHDIAEQRDYLERAVAADPFDSRARSALAKFQAKHAGLRVRGVDGRSHVVLPTQAGAEAQSYTCPNCAAPITFEPNASALACHNCGFSGVVDAHGPEPQVRAGGEIAIEYALVTERGHSWAATHHETTCDNCGAISLLPPDQKTTKCPYCGSQQLVRSNANADLIAPHAIIPFALDQDKAYKRFNRWLGNSILAPDDLAKMAKNTAIRPAYYPFWVFDATYHGNWSAEFNEGTSRNPRWVHRSGTDIVFYDDVVVPGNGRITMDDLRRIEPFKTKDGAADYKDDYVAGWPAFLYDISVADASIDARGKMAEHARGYIRRKVTAGRETRNFEVSLGDFSGKTFRHMLLPLWVGIYHYRGQEYHVLINGQTGKIGGRKPIDRVKIWLLVAIGVVIVLFVLAFLVLANWTFLFGPG